MARHMTRSNPRSDMVRSGAFPDIGNIGSFLRDFSLAPVLRELEQAPRMKVDIEENDQAYILKADVPGAEREDLTVTITGNSVSILADVEQDRTDQQGNMLRSERIYGEEFRTFTLPQEIDESKAEAKLENGVLVLTLPKKTSATKLDIRQQSASGDGQGQSGSASSQGKSASGSDQGKPS